MAKSNYQPNRQKPADSSDIAMLRQRERETDMRIGMALRHFRVQSGYSQSQLAEAVGVTFQQIQKYEKGLNRISVVRLLSLLEFLKIRLVDFWDKAQLQTNFSTHHMQQIGNHQALALMRKITSLSPELLDFAEKYVQHLTKLQSTTLPHHIYGSFGL